KGVNTTENVLSPATVPGLDLDWVSQQNLGMYSSPAVANGVVYVGATDNKLYAYPASCSSSPCAPLWVSQATGNVLDSPPSVANGVVYVGSVDDKLYAFSASCSTPCAPSWVSQATGGDIDSAPVVANGIVYVGSNDSKVYAFRASCSTPCPPV